MVDCVDQFLTDVGEKTTDFVIKIGDSVIETRFDFEEAVKEHAIRGKGRRDVTATLVKRVSGGLSDEITKALGQVKDTVTDVGSKVAGQINEVGAATNHAVGAVIDAQTQKFTAATGKAATLATDSIKNAAATFP
jgi:phage-related minor tail protein